MIHRTLSLILFFCATNAWSSYDAWKEQARTKYQMTDEQIASCQADITSAEAWDEFRKKHFQIPVTYPSRQAVTEAIAEKLSELDTEIAACQEDSSRLCQSIRYLFPTADLHPSGLQFKDYEQAVIEATTVNLKVTQQTFMEELSSYHLPGTVYPQEEQRRRLVTMQLIQERVRLTNNMGPVAQFWRISRLDNIFTMIARNLLNELVPSLFQSGVAGPYLSPCAEVWNSYQQRQEKLQELTTFAIQMETEMARWLHNSLDREGAVNGDDYNFLKTYWGYTVQGNDILFTASGEYMEKLRLFFLARQGVLLHELYLRGFQPRDFDEFLHGQAVDDQASWLNILSLMTNYMLVGRRHDGMFGFQHPELVRRSLRTCLEVNIPQRIGIAFTQMCAAMPDTPASEHRDDELERTFINQMRLQLIQLTDRCKGVLDQHNAVLRKLLAPGQPTEKDIDFLTGPRGMALIMNLPKMEEAQQTLAMIGNGEMLTDAGTEIRDSLLSFFKLIVNVLKTDEDLVRFKDKLKQRTIFLEQLTLLAHLTAIEEVLGDTLLIVTNEDGPYFGHHVDEEDKQLFFLLLDQAESYIPGLIGYLNSSSKALAAELE